MHADAWTFCENGISPTGDKTHSARLHDIFLKRVVPKGELQLFLSQYKQPIVGQRDETEHTPNNDGGETGA